jgi:hypothetical protein
MRFAFCAMSLIRREVGFKQLLRIAVAFPKYAPFTLGGIQT